MFRTIRLAVLVIAVTGGALWWGGHNLMIALHNREPVEITCAQYAAHPPDAEWLRLTHCDADVAHLAYKQATTKEHPVRRVYIPLLPEGSPDGTKATIIAERDDAEICELADALDAAQTHNRDIGDVTMMRLAKAVDGPTEGVIELGLDLSEADQRELAGLGINLAPQFAILERDAHPRPLIYAVAALAVGVLGIAFALAGLVRRFRS